MHLSYRILPVALLLSIWLQATAEQIQWRLGRTIEIPLQVSQTDQINTRTVVFPVAAVSNFIKYFADEDLSVKQSKNTLTLELRNPQFQGNVQVFDQNGNLYILRVKAADRSIPLDEMVIIQPDESASVGAPQSRISDSDSAVTAMVSHMLGGRMRSDITGAVVTTYKDGQVTPGSLIYQDDYFTMTIIKAWQGPTLKGYECVIHVNSKKPIKLDFRRLWFPGVLAIHCPELVSYSQNPDLQLDNDQVVTLFFVAE